MFTCHPIEKPFLIFQVGSADPDLAVQAARVVVDDVSGIELNCGCPKPFSTHAGMGAALLTNPDLLCSILSALRRELFLDAVKMFGADATFGKPFRREAVMEAVDEALGKAAARKS